MPRRNATSLVWVRAASGLLPGVLYEELKDEKLEKELPCDNELLLAVR